MNRISATILILSTCLASVVCAEETEQVKPIRILIVTGNDYPGHKWRETTPAVRAILEEDKRFEVYVAEDPEIMATPMAERYDAVVLHYCNWESPMPSLACREGLAKYVSSGKGLVALHFACGAFLEWPEYEKIIGRIWDQEKTHDPYREFTVNVCDADHPITRGLKDFEISDELYFCLKGEPKIDILLTAHSIKTDKDEPMGFVLNYGQGRVFHTPLGHDVKSFSAPGIHQLLRRACEWAATGDVNESTKQ